MKRYIPFALALTLCAAAVGLQGCATTGAALNPATANPAVSAVEQVAVEYGVGKLIEVGTTTQARQARAANIRQIATDIDGVAHGSSSTIAQLQQVATQKIAALNLQPSDALLASGLVTAIVTELQGKVSSGVLSASDLVVLDDVLGWVEQGCAVYGG